MNEELKKYKSEIEEKLKRIESIEEAEKEIKCFSLYIESIDDENHGILSIINTKEFKALDRIRLEWEDLKYVLLKLIHKKEEKLNRNKAKLDLIIAKEELRSKEVENE